MRKTDTTTKMIKLLVFWKKAHACRTQNRKKISRNTEPINLIQKLRKTKKSNVLRGPVSRPVFSLSFYFLLPLAFFFSSGLSVRRVFCVVNRQLPCCGRSGPSEAESTWDHSPAGPADMACVSHGGFLSTHLRANISWEEYHPEQWPAI